MNNANGLKGAVKTDRRIEKTRKLLHTALLDLIREKGYEHITLQDIVDRANVARTTFYLHFKDKDDLLFQGMRDMYDELIHEYFAHRPLGGETEEELMSIAVDFEHVEKYAEFYKAMLSPKGSMAFMMNIFSYLSNLSQTTPEHPLSGQAKTELRVPTEMLAYAMAGAEIGVVMWWLHQNKLQMPPQEICKYLYMISMYGADWAQGVDNPQRPNFPPLRTT